MLYIKKKKEEKKQEDLESKSSTDSYPSQDKIIALLSLERHKFFPINTSHRKKTSLVYVRLSLYVPTIQSLNLIKAEFTEEIQLTDLPLS